MDNVVIMDIQNTHAAVVTVSVELLFFFSQKNEEEDLCSGSLRVNGFVPLNRLPLQTLSVCKWFFSRIPERCLK